MSFTNENFFNSYFLVTEYNLSQVLKSCLVEGHTTNRTSGFAVSKSKTRTTTTCRDREVQLSLLSLGSSNGLPLAITGF